MIFVRVRIGAGTLGAVSVLGIIGVTLIRFATDLAIPGWATAVVGDLFIILLQTVVIVIATSLMMLAGRSHRPDHPPGEARALVARRQEVERGRAPPPP